MGRENFLHPRPFSTGLRGPKTQMPNPYIHAKLPRTDGYGPVAWCAGSLAWGPEHPRDDRTHFRLYLVAETMRKSLCRASTASGPGSSFCSSLTTLEQNFFSSSAWISLSREREVSRLVLGDPEMLP